MVTQEAFDEWEREWRTRLTGRSLIVEAGIPQADAIEAVSILGSNWVDASARTRTRLLERYRAVLLAGLCAIGSRDYDAGTYWPSVWRAFKMAGDQGSQGDLARSFKAGLDAFGLARFTLPLANVGEILMHSGLPVASVGAFTRALAKWDAANQSGDGRTFVAWMRSMSLHLATTKGIDVPTWRFLTEAGEIAEDFVDRCLLAIDQAGAGSGTSSTDLGLPAAILDEIARALEEARPAKRRALDRRSLAEQVPTLAYSPSRGISVELPPLEAHSETDIEWTVSYGGISKRIEVQAPWPGDPILPTWVSVKAPTQRVAISVTPTAQSWELDLVDIEDPLIAFDAENGHLVPPRNTLANGRVFLAFPNPDGSSTADLIEADSVAIVETHESPYGWEGWSFVAIDLTGTAKLRLRGMQRWRYVSTIVKPRLGAVEALSFVATRDERPIMAHRPILELPGTGQVDSHVPWVVAVTDASDGRIVSTHKHVVGAETLAVDPWESSERVFGDFLIAARGPLGRGVTVRAAVAEGFSTTASAPMRWMSDAGTGLEPATVRVLEAEAGMQVGRELALDALVEQRAESFSVDGSELELMARIPFMSVSSVGKIERPAAIVPLALDLEGLVDTTLRATVPADARSVKLAAVVGGELVQVLSSSLRASSGLRIFNLSQLSGTLEEHGSAQLRLIVDDRSVPVAYVRPRRLASGVRVDETGTLDLVDGHPVEGLKAIAYPRHAPWAHPFVLEFPAGSTSLSLPDDLRREGSATFVLVVSNPWLPLQPPPLPDWSSGNAFVSDVGGLIDRDEPAESGFRPWLAGLGACPTHEASMPIALKIYTLLPKIVLAKDAEHLRTEIAAAVRQNRELLMEAVLAANTESRDLVRLFVESDVVTVPCEAWESSELLWSYSPGLGVIADSDEYGGPADEAFRDNLAKHVGADALTILDNGVDAAQRVGKFGDPIIVMDAWPQERVDMVWEKANVLPTALLDEDTRAKSAKLLFDKRRDKDLRFVAAASQKLLAITWSAIARDLGPDAVAPVMARVSRDGWANLPALSLAFAFVARLSARGGPASTHAFGSIREAYARLSANAPEIVQQDLGLAELWITREYAK